MKFMVHSKANDRKEEAAMNEQLQKIINRLESRTELQQLSPKQIWNAELDAEIAALDLTKQNADKTVIALMAGLHLWNDSLDRSHSFAQQIEDDPTGSYWHAIMHRMEQDYSNSKYWFRQTGHHPVKNKVQVKAAELLKHQVQLDSLPPSPIVKTLKQFRDQQSWNCDEFVDLVQLQENGQGTDETRKLLEQLQRIELVELFQYTYEAI
jgi:hypothetical protein